jgi:hypothetical protein
MRKHLALLAIILLGAMAAGCQQMKAISGFAITQNQLDAAESTYDGTSLVALDKYAALPACKAGQAFSLQIPCHDKATLKKWRSIDNDVATGISHTQNAITSGDNTGAVGAWNALQTALTAAQQIAASSGASTL